MSTTSKMIVVRRKLTKRMIEAADEFYWTSSSREKRIQLMWDAMLEASDHTDIKDKQYKLFEMGKREGREEIQNKLKELLNITDCEDN